MLSPSPDPGWSLSSAAVNLFSTGRFLLSPGVATDRGEGVVGSAVLYSVRDIYRALPHPTFSLLASTLTPPDHKALGTFLWQTSYRSSEPYSPLPRSSLHRHRLAACSRVPPTQAFSRHLGPQTSGASSRASSSLVSSTSLS